ncbi:MAG TPA: tetratricopeptide repeat protein, partial [Sphingomicrobium sp.]|nr:tetratricopeptide repeat protein [Sphingomicrobium sp.]
MSRPALLAAAMLAGVAGCAAPKLEIREVGSAHVKQKGEPTSGRVALGLTQLAMGNVGLAVESFRRALREDPQSHQAMLGLAECYLQMGKPSLARRSLEQALALR